MPVIVQRSSSSVVVQRDESPVVQAVSVPQVNTTRQENATTVAASLSQVVTLASQGPVGPQGPAGTAADGSVQPIDFSFGDASAVIWTPSEAGTVTLARLVIDTVFNGAGAALSLGTAAAPTSILDTAMIDPTGAGEYEATADVHLSALQGVRLSITPGVGASQGAGTVYLTFIPD